MTNEQKRYALASGLLLVALTFFCASWYVKTQQSEYRDQLNTLLTAQESKMSSLSMLIDRDEADEAVRRIVADCSQSERERFDTLLGSLSQLSRSDLVEISNLFAVCGSFYADQQAILAMRLKRELEIHQELTNLLILTDTDVSEQEAEGQQWQELTNLEQDRSALTAELVSIQGVIIDLLLSGKTVSSEEIVMALEKAQTTKDSLSLLNTQADELRARLTNL